MIMLSLLLCVLTLTETSELANRASLIANNEFHHTAPASVIWWQSDPNIVTDFLKNYRGSVTIMKINKTHNSDFNGGIVHKQTIFFAVDPEEFMYFVTNLNETIIYPIRVLLVITLPVNNISSLEQYTKICMENDVSDILIVSTSSNDSTIRLTTYMPHVPEDCGNHDPVSIDSNAKNLFPQKYNNFNRCPVKVIITSSFPYVITTDYNVDNIRGIDLDFLVIALEKLNASTFKFLSNNSGAHILSHVNAGDYDMCLPSIVLSSKRYRKAQASHVFKTLNIVICAPNQREIYAWAKVLLPFFTNITPLIVLSFLTFLGSVVLIRRFGKLRTNVAKGIIFGTLGLFLGQGIKFETKYWLNNWIFMLWIWYCTIVRIAYQSDLVDGLQKTFLEPHLKSVAEGLRAVDEYGGPEGLMMLTTINSSNIKKTIMSWKDIPNYVEEISQGRRFLLLTDISLIHHSPYKVQVVDERLTSMPAAFFMRPRWGAAGAVDHRMVQLFEAGFMAKIIRDHEAKTWKGKSTRSVDPLDLNTVASCFFGLVILGFLWTIVLCLEIVWYNFVEKNK